MSGTEYSTTSVPIEITVEEDVWSGAGGYVAKVFLRGKRRAFATGATEVDAYIAAIDRFRDTLAQPPIPDPCTCATSELCGTIACPEPQDWRDNLRGILAEAGRLVESDRSEAYGRPVDNHRRIAALWNAWLDTAALGQADYATTPLEAEDAAMMMLLVKVARLMETPDHRDSITDLIGYALVYADCIEPSIDRKEGTDD